MSIIYVFLRVSSFTFPQSHSHEKDFIARHFNFSGTKVLRKHKVRRANLDYSQRFFREEYSAKAEIYSLDAYFSNLTMKWNRSIDMEARKKELGTYF